MKDKAGIFIGGFLTALFVGLLIGAAVQLPNYEKNSWSTNVTGWPVQGSSNLVISNLNNDLVWNFYYRSSNTVARLADLTNVVEAYTNVLATTNYVYSVVTNNGVGGPWVNRTLGNGGLADGGNESTTNIVFRVPVGVSSNIYVTNMADPQQMTLMIFPTNGTTVSFPQVTAVNSTDGRVLALSSNNWNKVIVTRSGSDTNFQVEAGTLELVPSTGITFATNYAANTLSVSASAAFAALEVQTNGVRVGLVTNVNFTAGVTGSVSASTATLGVSASGGASLPTGSTNYINLSVQAVKWAATNYSYTDPGWQAWETVYTETNEVGTRANLEGSWQFLVPPDYATNSLSVLLNYSIINTNGPNTSNVIWGASVLVGRSGTTNNIRTNAFGSLVFGTNDWIAKYDGTNYVTNLVVSLGTSSLLMAGDLAVLKLVRDATNDTYGGAVALHGLQLQYTRP